MFYFQLDARTLSWKLSVNCAFFFKSIIIKLEEHEEFFPAFQAFTNELLEILGKISVGGG